METKLIIIRGNSASGKSTVARTLQRYFGPNTLLVQQDVIRREMLMTRDIRGNLAIDLIYDIAAYGKGKCQYVIVEGILTAARYSDMLKRLIAHFDRQAYIYYFHLPFEETVRRHATRDKAKKFGEEELRQWWIEKDVLGVPNETYLTADFSADEVVHAIIRDVE